MKGSRKKAARQYVKALPWNLQCSGQTDHRSMQGNLAEEFFMLLGLRGFHDPLASHCALKDTKAASWVEPALPFLFFGWRHFGSSTNFKQQTLVASIIQLQTLCLPNTLLTLEGQPACWFLFFGFFWLCSGDSGEALFSTGGSTEVVCVGSEPHRAGYGTQAYCMVLCFEVLCSRRRHLRLHYVFCFTFFVFF